jgi:hypothetical protein
MHTSNLVIIDRPEEGITKAAIETLVEEQMERGHNDWWDWYQIGGRWTGALDGYDPTKDPANQEPCRFCNATGKRTDMVVANGCNACNGTGIAQKWPTEYGFREGDIVPLETLTQETYVNQIHRVVCSYGDYASEEYVPWAPEGEKFPKRDLPPLEWLKKTYPESLAVIVDSHN